jgi:ribosomal protein L20
MNIENGGVIYYLPKIKGEVNTVYFDRINLVIRERPKTLNSIINLNKKYDIECNKKYLKCEY